METRGRTGGCSGSGESCKRRGMGARGNWDLRADGAWCGSGLDAFALAAVGADGVHVLHYPGRVSGGAVGGKLVWFLSRAQGRSTWIGAGRLPGAANAGD